MVKRVYLLQKKKKIENDSYKLYYQYFIIENQEFEVAIHQNGKILLNPINRRIWEADEHEKSGSS